MDLVSGARTVVCIMTHNDKSGGRKLVPTCTLPLTGLGCVDVVVSDLGVFRPSKRVGGGFVVVELAEGHSLDEVRARTGADLHTT